MKILLTILSVFFLLSSAFAEVGDVYYPYPKVAVELKDDKIILQQRDNIYEYPSSKDDWRGIEKVVLEDINGDGKEEYIIAVRLEGVEGLPKLSYSVVLVCEQNGSKLDVQQEIITGNYSPEFELVDVNKDGIKEIIAMGTETPRWRYLKILSRQDDKYVFLWNEGEGTSFVRQVFEINENGDAQIRTGTPLGTTEDGRFSYEPVWETWVWDGGKFVRSPEQEPVEATFKTSDNVGSFRVTPDGKKVIFVKYVKECPWNSDTGWFPSSFDEIWEMDIESKAKRCLIKNNFAQVKKTDDWDDYLGSFDSLYISPDGEKIYFLCQNSTTSAVLYIANVDGTDIKRIRYAHQLDMVGGNPGDEYYGYLVAGIRKQPPGAVPIRWTAVLMDPEGNEVKEIDDIENFWQNSERL